ncbi:MAG: diguanylate cyclase [Candidatus Omnitrophota bacterium]
MKYFFKYFKLNSKFLLNELAIAFGLVLMAFLVFMAYLFPGASSIFQVKTNLNIVIFILFFLLSLGFIIIAQMIEPVIKISKDAKKIAEGDLNREITLARNDEIGQLGDALNNMSQRIKDNLKELKEFSEKTETINVEINKRILTLSSLIQIGNLLSQHAELDEIFHIGVEKCSAGGDVSLSCLLLAETQTDEFGIRILKTSQDTPLREGQKLRIISEQGLLGRTLSQQTMIMVDKNRKKTQEVEECQKIFALANIILAPIISKGISYGLLVAGNNQKDFSFSTIDCELMDLISKQISVAIENDTLAARLERLEIIDQLTGLYNKFYMHERLNEEIQRAIRFQRPCAFVILSIDHFEKYFEAFGHLSAENALMKIGQICKENANEVDKVGRFGDHEFALILPEKNKKRSIELAEDIRKKIEFFFAEEEDALKKLTCTGAVTENPLDGMTADELITKAQELLEGAKAQGGNTTVHKK